MWNLSAVGAVTWIAEATDDPVTPGSSATWDVELIPKGKGAPTYASTSLSKVFFGGDTLDGGTQFIQGIFSGIVEYRTRDFFGAETTIPIGIQQDADGVVPSFIDDFVIAVTFGWGVSTVSIGECTIHMEIFQD